MILLGIMMLRLISLIDVLGVRNYEKPLLEILDKSVLRLRMIKFQFDFSFVKIIV